MSDEQEMSTKEWLLMTLFGDNLNRPLSAEDQTCRLRQKQRHEVALNDGGMLLRYNSQFMELVNPLHLGKGFLEFCYVIFLLLMTFLACISMYMIYDSLVSLIHKFFIEEVFYAVVFFIFFLIGLMAALHCLDFLFKNTYPYTHHAVRFCRQTRRVYAYVPRVSVFSKLKPFIDISWDDAFFVAHNDGALIPGVDQYRWFLSLYELDHPRQLNKALIKNGVIIGVPAEGSDMRDNQMLGQWEFIRRYMEEGPEAVPAPETMLPIAFRRETLWQGFRMLIGSKGDRVIQAMFLPLMLVAAPFRWLQMHVAPKLTWPAYVEAACVIAPDDAFHYEADKCGRAVKVNKSSQ